MPETLVHHIARRVRELRDRRGWSQAELAHRLAGLGLRFDRITIAKIETGNRSVKIGEAVQLAAALGVAPSTLLFGGDEDLEIAPTVTLPALFARAWNRGDAALREDDAAFYKDALDNDERFPMAMLAEMFLAGDLKITDAGRGMFHTYVAEMRRAREFVLGLPGGDEATHALEETFNLIDRLEEALS